MSENNGLYAAVQNLEILSDGDSQSMSPILPIGPTQSSRRKKHGFDTSFHPNRGPEPIMEIPESPRNKDDPNHAAFVNHRLRHKGCLYGS